MVMNGVNDKLNSCVSKILHSVYFRRRKLLDTSILLNMDNWHQICMYKIVFSNIEVLPEFAQNTSK